MRVGSGWEGELYWLELYSMAAAEQRVTTPEIQQCFHTSTYDSCRIWVTHMQYVIPNKTEYTWGKPEYDMVHHALGPNHLAEAAGMYPCSLLLYHC